MKEAAKLHIPQTTEELESGLPSLPEKPGRLFDEGENVLRIIRLPHDPENAPGQRYTVVPPDFAAKLKALPREEAIRELRAYAEARFQEIQEAGIACSPRTISTDVLVSTNDAGADKARGDTEPAQELIVATKKISGFHVYDKVADIKSLPIEQQRQWYADCLALYKKLLAYYRAQHYARPPRPLMDDITRLRQYAYVPNEPDRDKRFVLIDADVVIGTHRGAYERFLNIAIGVLDEIAAYALSNNITPSPIDNINQLRRGFQDELEKLQ